MARPVRHYGQWRIRWTDSQGRRHSETYAQKADAELALKRHEVEAEEIRRGLRGLTAPHHTFGEVCDYWLERRAPAKRSGKDDRSIIRRYLRPAFGGLAAVVFRDTFRGNGFSLVMRYQTMLERSLRRGLHELERRQAMRRGQTPVPPLAVDLDLEPDEGTPTQGGNPDNPGFVSQTAGGWEPPAT